MSGDLIPVPPVSAITKAYSGKPGCACGCRGDYYTDSRNIKRIRTIIERAQADCPARVEHYEDYVTFEQVNPNRVYTVYTRALTEAK